MPVDAVAGLPVEGLEQLRQLREQAFRVAAGDVAGDLDPELAVFEESEPEHLGRGLDREDARPRSGLLALAASPEPTGTDLLTFGHRQRDLRADEPVDERGPVLGDVVPERDAHQRQDQEQAGHLGELARPD